MSLTHSDPSTDETPAPADGVDPGDIAVEFSAHGKSADEARTELFSSLTRLEPTTATERMLEQAPDPSVTSFDFLPRIPTVTTDSLPYAPLDPPTQAARPPRRSGRGVVAAGVVSAGIAVTLFTGAGWSGSPFELGQSARSTERAPSPDPSILTSTIPSGSFTLPGSASSSNDLGATAAPPAVGPANPAGPATPVDAAGAADSAALEPVRAMFVGGRMVLTGTVPTRADADALVARTASLLGPGSVVDRLHIDPTAPSMAGVPVHVAERVRFAPGSTAVDGEYLALVAAWRDVMAAVPTVQMTITGFTDDRGPADLNDRLALERAQGVADWMQTQGIAGDRFVVAGGGSTSPVAPNDTPEGRAENRRIQVELNGLLTR
jgi:outer membrane protein OmpA-like peptidoglycan-associated protein